jgi:hypothetical protein
MFHGHLDDFQKPPLGGRPDTKSGDHGTLNIHNCWFILFYHVWIPAWIEINWNNIWLRVRSHMASHYTWRSVTTVHDLKGVLGRPLDTFLLGSHNFMVTALESCVKWPLMQLFVPSKQKSGWNCGWLVTTTTEFSLKWQESKLPLCFYIILFNTWPAGCRIDKHEGKKRTSHSLHSYS